MTSKHSVYASFRYIHGKAESALSFILKQHGVSGKSMCQRRPGNSNKKATHSAKLSTGYLLTHLVAMACQYNTVAPSRQFTYSILLSRTIVPTEMATIVAFVCPVET